MKRGLISIIIALAFIAAACGSSEDDFRAQMREDGMSDATIDCLIEELDNRGLSVDDVSDQTLGDSEPPAGAIDAMLACQESVLADLADGGLGDLVDGDVDFDFDDIDADLSTFGDEDLMAGLMDDCGAGDNAACDDLWLNSPVGSPEETFAESCGGRTDDELWGRCEEVLG